jgi:hypothetical protein
MSERPATPRHDALVALEAAGAKADVYRSIWANDLARESRAVQAFEANEEAAQGNARLDLARTVGGPELAHLLELEADPRAAVRAQIYRDANAPKIQEQQRRFEAAMENPPPPEAA